MNPDIVQNDHVGQIFITVHARKSWVALGHQGSDLNEALKRAVPFGGQYGCGMLSIGDVVFATKRSGENRSATAVLSMGEAFANVERFRQAQSIRYKKATREVLAKVIELHVASDEDFKREMELAEGPWLQLLQRYFALRKEIRRLRAHANLMERDKRLLYAAACALLTEEQLQQVQQKRGELEAAQGEDQAP